MKITKEVKTALMVLLSVMLLIFGYNFLNGKNLFSNERVFYALYDNVEGLTKSSKVTINGFQVGKINDISFANAEGKLKVTFVVESNFQFGKNSIAKIYSGGIIGGKHLAIVPEKKPIAMAQKGDFLKSSIDSGLMDLVTTKLDPIEGKLNGVLSKVDLTLSSINGLLNKENTDNISKSLADLTNTLSSLKYTVGSVQSLVAQNEIKLGQVINNFQSASENIDVFSEELSKAPVQDLVTKLNRTVTTFSEISEKIESGKGTAGKLINDPTVYNNLNRATRQLDLLLQDVKLNPKRYVHFSVFGKKGQEYIKPADSLK